MRLPKKCCSEQAEVFATVKYSVGDEVYFPASFPTSPESLQNFEVNKGTISAIVLYATSMNYRVVCEYSEIEVVGRLVAEDKVKLLKLVVDDMVERWKSNYEYAYSKLKKEEE